MKLRCLVSWLSSVVLITLSCAGNVVLDSFNTSESFTECCDSNATRGTYGTFTGNVSQNGDGLLRISGTANGYGGLLRNTAFNILHHSNLVIRAKLLPGNTATSFYVHLLDANSVGAYFSFSAALLSSNSFTTLTQSLFTPSFVALHIPDSSTTTFLRDMVEAFTSLATDWIQDP
jgi:hypothetical protein